MLNLIDNIPDVQNDKETRKIAICHVGIKDLHYPFRWFRKDGSFCESIGRFSLDIFLSAEKRGTHMSRFVQLIEEQQTVFDIAKLCEMADNLLNKLESSKGRILVHFPFFLRKVAPQSEIKSLLDYNISVEIIINRQGGVSCFRNTLIVRVPVTSLCPCSKQISKYGAHNQRSIVTIKVELAENQNLAVEDLILVAESQASSELFGVLKREDEKAVTEKAYENAKFVEDIIRDVAIAIQNDKRISSYMIEVENFESIHNHSAYACIIK